MSLQQFPMSSSSESPIFTDLFLILYPELMEDSSTSVAFPDNSSLVLSTAYDSPVLDIVAPPSPESPIGLDLRHFTWVSIPPLYLIDYHCSFALTTLYKPHIYHETHTDPLWQQVMSKELDAIYKNYTWDMVYLPLG